MLVTNFVLALSSTYILSPTAPLEPVGIYILVIGLLLLVLAAYAT